MSELAVPPTLAADPNALELLRAWLANGELECTLNVGIFEDPSSWGELLAHLARNVAEGLREQEGREPEEVLQRIRTVFNDELPPST